MGLRTGMRPDSRKTIWYLAAARRSTFTVNHYRGCSAHARYFESLPTKSDGSRTFEGPKHNTCLVISKDQSMIHVLVYQSTSEGSGGVIVEEQGVMDEVREVLY